MALIVAFRQISADIVLNRMRRVARNEKNRRAQHPSGITLVVFEHHLISNGSDFSAGSGPRVEQS